jgi:hypothetical protein
MLKCRPVGPPCTLAIVQIRHWYADNSCMPFLRRKPPPEPAPDATQVWVRNPPRACFGCHRTRPPYVYAENGHDYCIDCATKSYAVMGLRPGGARQDDITLEELVRLSEQSRSAERDNGASSDG